MKSGVSLAVLAALALSGCMAPASVEVPRTPTPPIPSGGPPSPASAATPSALPVLMSRETSLREAPLTITVNSLHTTAGSTTLNFTVTNRGNEPWHPWTSMGSTTDLFSVSGTYLVDGVHGRRLLPARDVNDRCVCSSTDSRIGPRQSTTFSAVFAPLPAEVTTVAVSIPGAGVFDQVPVSR